MRGRRDVPQIGAVVAGSTPLMPYVVVDGAGAGVDVVNEYLRDRMLGDVSPLTCRSYGYDLLRWFRLLWLLEVDWDKATEAEAAVMVGWLRNAGNPQRSRRPGSPQPGSVNVRTGKPEPGAGYAPATIAHVLTVVSGFYDFHMHFGNGPLVNPVPQNASRRAALSHRSPLEDPLPYRRARLRPKVIQRGVRSIPDGLLCQLGGTGLGTARAADGRHRLGGQEDLRDLQGITASRGNPGVPGRVRVSGLLSRQGRSAAGRNAGLACPARARTPAGVLGDAPGPGTSERAAGHELDLARPEAHDGGQARGRPGHHARRDTDDHASRTPDHHPAVYGTEAG